jgi:hypothetical protein
MERLEKVRERTAEASARVENQIKALAMASEALACALEPQPTDIAASEIAEAEPEFEITASIRELLRSEFHFADGRTVRCKT